jgi:hypothetical protein
MEIKFQGGSTITVLPINEQDKIRGLLRMNEYNVKFRLSDGRLFDLPYETAVHKIIDDDFQYPESNYLTQLKVGDKLLENALPPYSVVEIVWIDKGFFTDD